MCKFHPSPQSKSNVGIAGLIITNESCELTLNLCFKYVYFKNTQPHTHVCNQWGWLKDIQHTLTCLRMTLVLHPVPRSSSSGVSLETLKT